MAPRKNHLRRKFMSGGNRDWLPQNRGQRIAMAHLWIEVFSVNGAEWNISTAEINQLRLLAANAEDANVRAEASQGSRILIAQANEHHEILGEYMRLIHRTKLFSPPLAGSDFISLGLRPHDMEPTETPVPTSIPEIEAVTSVIRELTFRFRDFGARRWARPDHVSGIDFRWEIKEARPGHVEEILGVESFSSGPFTLSFGEHQRGQRVFFAARWVNSRLKGGPWSDIESAVIP